MAGCVGGWLFGFGVSRGGGGLAFGGPPMGIAAGAGDDDAIPGGRPGGGSFGGMGFGR